MDYGISKLVKLKYVESFVILLCWEWN